MLEIAQNKGSKGVFQKEIASNQSLSNKYLDQIIHELKTSGLICNVKGKKSGYMLTRRPEDITVFDIHQAFEADVCLVECLSANFLCERSDKCLARGVWKQLNIIIINYLRSVTLAGLINNPMAIENFEEISKADDN
jgi:Rrf2 family protein